MDPIKFDPGLKGERPTPALPKAKAEQAEIPQDSVKLQGKQKNNLIPKPESRPSAADPKDSKKWTLMVYSAADNNLLRYQMEDVNEMEKSGSDDNTNIVVQFDHGKETGSKRYYLTRNMLPGINSPEVDSLGAVNMSDPRTLSNFIKWGMKNYPAENYFLILADHGGGWDGLLADDGHGGWMSTPQLQEGLRQAEAATGRKIDVLGFDACLMGSAEVAYQIKDNADFMVASQANEGADGWPYSRILSSKVLKELQEKLTQKINVTPQQLAQKIVKNAQGSWSISTLSALDLKAMKNVAACLDQLGKSILNTNTPPDTIKAAFNNAQKFDDFSDLFGACQNILGNADITDQQLKSSARTVLESLKQAIIAEQHSGSYPNAHGLHVQGPSWYLSGGYQNLELAKDTNWDEALNKLSKNWFKE